MNTTDAYFSPGDEELEVWVVPPTHKPVTQGYVKGQFRNEAGIMRLGTIREHGSGQSCWSEEVIQKMAESMMEEGFIFFFLRVVSTTSLEDDLSPEAKERYRNIAREADGFCDAAEARIKGLGDYDKGYADGMRLILDRR